MNYKRSILIFALFFFCLMSMAEDKEVYLKHASGLVAGRSAQDGRAKIFAPTSTEATKLKLRDVGDGYFLIVHTDNDGTETYMTLNGSWNTYFENNASTDNAKYKIDGDENTLFLLRNKANGRCLGSDSNDSGSNLYSDKGGDDPKHFWYLASDKNAPIPTANSTYFISTTDLRQQNEGWGVSLCWWANMCGKWSDKKIDEIIDWLVSPTGLNFNIFRYNIGGGDDPLNRNCEPHHMDRGKGHRAEMEGFKTTSDDEYDWTKDEAQRKIMLKIREKRPDAIFEAFSNTPPYYMTYSGCCSGNDDGGKDNLKPEYYEEFAHYLVDVCKHYKDEYGIEFKTLEPFNEATTSYWYRNGVQEGCHFDNQSQIEFIKVLYPILKESGLNTVISASDETSVWGSYVTLQEYEKAGILDMVDQWNTHTYVGNDRDRYRLGTTARLRGKTLWMSETGSGGNGIGGNLNMTQRMFDDIRGMLPSAWIDWQYVEEPNDQWCFVKGNFANQTYERVKNYYVRQQVTSHIKQGYHFVTSLSSKTLCAVNEARDTLVVVVLNNGSAVDKHTAHITGSIVDGTITAYQTTSTTNHARIRRGYSCNDNILSFEAPAQTITTFLIPIKSNELGDNEGNLSTSKSLVEEETDYIIMPQYATPATIASVSNTMKLKNIDIQQDTIIIEASQVWQFSPMSNGTYRITNLEGDIITATNSYALATSKRENNNQAFSIINLDGYYCKIAAALNNKCMDLQNEGTTAGTTVGLWDYGTEPSTGHRNWHFMALRPYVEPTPDDPIEDAISETRNSNEASAFFDLSGVKTTAEKKGIVIVRFADGYCKKMMRK